MQRTQYGHLTDTLKIAELLASDMDVSVICFDAGMEKTKSRNISIEYVNRNGNLISRSIRIIFRFISAAHNNKSATVFIVYFPFCSLIKIFGNDNSIVDFRSGSVHRTSLMRFLTDLLGSIESRFFKKVTLISDGLRFRLRISSKKSFILPLGSDEISNVPKVFDEPRMFYIGTLNGRNIHQTIEGISIFLKRNPAYKNKISYDIVGDGYSGELDRLKTLVLQLGLENIVRLQGRMSHQDAQIFFDTCNIGVSYVPMTDYYNHQPPTKTYEYARSGMIVIGTSTAENTRVIKPENGVLCFDNSESFSHALEKCINNFDNYSDLIIRKSFAKYSWEKIAIEFKKYLLAK